MKQTAVMMDSATMIPFRGGWWETCGLSAKYSGDLSPPRTDGGAMVMSCSVRPCLAVGEGRRGSGLVGDDGLRDGMFCK